MAETYQVEASQVKLYSRRFFVARFLNCELFDLVRFKASDPTHFHLVTHHVLLHGVSVECREQILYAKQRVNSAPTPQAPIETQTNASSSTDACDIFDHSRRDELATLWRDVQEQLDDEASKGLYKCDDCHL